MLQVQIFCYIYKVTNCMKKSICHLRWKNAKQAQNSIKSLKLFLSTQAFSSLSLARHRFIKQIQSKWVSQALRGNTVIFLESWDIARVVFLFCFSKNVIFILTVIKNIKGDVLKQIFIILLSQSLQCTSVCLKTVAENASVLPGRVLGIW